MCASAATLADTAIAVVAATLWGNQQPIPWGADPESRNAACFLPANNQTQWEFFRHAISDGPGLFPPYPLLSPLPHFLLYLFLLPFIWRTTSSMTITATTTITILLCHRGTRNLVVEKDREHWDPRSLTQGLSSRLKHIDRDTKESTPTLPLNVWRSHVTTFCRGHRTSKESLISNSLRPAKQPLPRLTTTLPGSSNRNLAVSSLLLPGCSNVSLTMLASSWPFS